MLLWCRLPLVLKGICSVIRKAEKEVDTKTFAKAMEAGTKVAYGAVSAPKEGTILTVARESVVSESADSLPIADTLAVDSLKEETTKYTPKQLRRRAKMAKRAEREQIKAAQKAIQDSIDAIEHIDLTAKQMEILMFMIEDEEEEQ